MGRQANGGSDGRQENKRWSLIRGPRFLTILLVISMIHVATSQDKMSTLDQGSNIILSPRNVKTTGKTNTQSNRVCNSSECIAASKEIERSMNLTVDPCDDFDAYACGRWHLNNPLPPGNAFYNLYSIADNQTDQFKRRILERTNIRVIGTTSELRQMPSDFYNSCINLTAIDNLGDAPLRERITELGGWSMSGNWDEDNWDFNETLLSMHKITNVGPLFRLGIVPDKDIKKKFYLVQAGPTLEKGQYLNLSSKTMLAYRQRIIEVVVLLGVNANTAAKKADEIIRLEAKLADVSFTKSEWNARLTITRTVEQLQQEVPEMNWSNYFNKLFEPSTIPKSEVIIIPTLPYIKKAMRIIENTPKSVLANYMVWFMISSEIEWLSAPFRKVQLEYKNATEGIKSEKERWKICVDLSSNFFDDMITTAYVSENQAQLTKRISLAKQYFKDVFQAFKDNVKSLTWLDQATKIEVFDKVNGIQLKIGYPDYLLNATLMATLLKKHNGITIKKETYYKNILSIVKTNRQRKLKDFKKPRNEIISKWDPSPLKANILYNFVQNSMTFPASILRPPFLYPNKFLRAYNLGKFGFLVGHDMMHAFGNSGRRHDKDGKKKDWWSTGLLLEFNKRLKCYEKQYSAYKILGKWPINGAKTAEENVADSAGLKIALKAYYNWVKQNPSETWRLSGLKFTNEQLFYIGFAQDRWFFVKFLRVRQCIQVQKEQPNESSQQMLSLE